MVEKRPLEDSAAQAVAAPGEGNGTADAKKPKLSLDALEKAKKALQLQKELKEKLKKLPQLAKTDGATPAAAAPVPGASAVASQAGGIAAATAKAAEVAARFGVSITPAAPAAPSSSTAPSAAFKPAPLLLDASGRQVDAQGNVLSIPTGPVPTLRVNQAAGLQPKPSQPGTSSVLPLSAPPPPEPESDAFFDPRMTSAASKRVSRKTRATFDFVQEGTFQKQAEEFRLKARYGPGAKPIPRGPIGPALASGDPNLVPIGGGNANLVPIGGGAGPAAVPTAETEQQDDEDLLEPLPDVEWWDRNLLASGSYQQDVPEDPSQPVNIKEGKITVYVEHPVPIQPPAEAPPPPPQPLKLTARELKKLRTQRRQAREKEKQDLIRQGLLEPAKPKVKISNLYRVLGEQAIADPTRLEMETKKQMQERQAAHDDRNLARSLTAEEKKEKKLKKMFDDTGLEVITSVYRVSRMENKQHRYKVDINAKENHMTGMLFITPEFSLVVVEGCNKATKRYAKLMLRRIDWTEPPSDKKGLDDDEMDTHEEDPNQEPNRCDLVWQGLVKQAAFQGFKTEKCQADHAQQILTQREVLHYWHAAQNFVPGESRPVTLE